MAHPSLNDAYGFLEKIFNGKKDKGGVPLYTHSFRVLRNLASDGDFSDRSMCYAALLHDVLEDTHYTGHDLLTMGFSPRTVQLVKHLTRNREETYEQYIDRLIEHGDCELLRIKLADLKDNMDPHRICMLPASEGMSLLARYEKAQKKITKSLNVLREGISVL